jgi:hypothetical protein
MVDMARKAPRRGDGKRCQLFVLDQGYEAPASATDAVTWPAATSAMDCGLFRYGTWAISKANRNSGVRRSSPPTAVAQRRNAQPTSIEQRCKIRDMTDGPVGIRFDPRRVHIFDRATGLAIGT